MLVPCDVEVGTPVYEVPSEGAWPVSLGGEWNLEHKRLLLTVPVGGYHCRMEREHWRETHAELNPTNG